VLGVIVGSMVTWITTAAALAAAYFGLGVDVVFLPGGYEASAPWVAMGLVAPFIGGLVGGWSCRALAGPGRAPLALSVLVFLLGIVNATLMIPVENGAPPAVRIGAVPLSSAQMLAKTPAWSWWVNPVFGVAGVLIGAVRRREKL
jgi:hypothetical protein